LPTADSLKDSSTGRTRAGAGAALLCLWLLQTLLERAQTPGSPLMEAPSKMRVGRRERAGKVRSIFGH